MPDAVAELAAQYGSNIEIVPGPHKDTKVPASMKKYKAEVTTLDGRVVR